MAELASERRRIEEVRMCLSELLCRSIKYLFIVLFLTASVASQVTAGPGQGSSKAWGKGGRWQNSDTAPTISGSPTGTVTVGNAYNFQPTASDADGDILTFSIANKPSWASFSSSKGTLSGTPATSGTFDNIVISVSDGTASASLSAFTIDVQAAPAPTGSFTLQWTAPTTRSDGTSMSLSDIGGYHIYYGTSAGNYTDQIDVSDGSVQAATITDMPVGTYYLVMTTYDVGGLESAYSSMATKIAE